MLFIFKNDQGIFSVCYPRNFNQFTPTTFEPRSWSPYDNTNIEAMYALIAHTSSGSYYLGSEIDKIDPVGKILENPEQAAEQLTLSNWTNLKTIEDSNLPASGYGNLMLFPIVQTGVVVSDQIPHTCRVNILVMNPWVQPLAVTVTQPVSSTMTIDSISEPGVLQDEEIVWNIQLYPHETKVLTYDFIVDDPNIQQTGFATIPPAVMSIYDALNDSKETFETGNTKIVFNYPPIAEAGPIQTVERSSHEGAHVQLDGSASYDPEGEELTYEWTWAGGSASGVNPTVTLPPGLTTVTLTVFDGFLSSTDTVDINVEDTMPPEVDIIIPQSYTVLQDTITLTAEANDISDVAEVYFYIREPNDGNGTPIGHEDVSATFNSVTGKWEKPFDTTVLDDGYYVILAKAVDTYGNEGWSEIVPFSIRNWAVPELPPETEEYRAGRTMPIKFSLRISEAVDPAMPFVYNEELEIRIYKSSDPDNILQTSLFGDRSTDYRIDIDGRLYITNFKTDKKAAKYTVEIWRAGEDFGVGGFIFETTRK